MPSERKDFMRKNHKSSILVYFTFNRKNCSQKLTSWMDQEESFTSNWNIFKMIKDDYS
jgi:hypothetical protein